MRSITQQIKTMRLSKGLTLQQLANLQEEMAINRANSIISDRSLKRYSKMTPEQKTAEADVLVKDIRDLLEAGCM